MINRILSSVGLRLVRAPRNEKREDARDWRISDALARRVGKYELFMYPRSPLYKMYRDNPTYQAELGRIARVVNEKYPDCGVIDVGANIGDTIAIIRSACNAKILAVEGDPTSCVLLEKNIATHFPDAQVARIFLGERDRTISANLDQQGFNTTIVPANSGRNLTELTLRSLDSLLATRQDATEYRMVKIDAEGLDTAILRGAWQFLKTQHPVLFFEYNHHPMAMVGENGSDTVLQLATIGYKHVMVWDSNGRFLLANDHAANTFLADLCQYASMGGAWVGYFDFCVFHESDGDIAGDCLRAEREYQRRK